MQTITTFDSGQRAVVIEEPFSINYECSRCHSFTVDTTPHSYFDGERWVRRHYCWDCIEAVV